jgi:DNA replication licensing factor MCM6
MCRYTEGAAEPFYEMEMEVMRSRESTAIDVDFAHVMRFNDVLQKAISEEYLRSDWSVFHFDLALKIVD